MVDSVDGAEMSVEVVDVWVIIFLNLSQLV